MKCGEFNKKIILYIDQELQEEVSRQFILHLDSCPDCKKKYDTIRSIYALAGDEINDYRGNPFFSQRVISRINTTLHPHPANESIKYITISGLAIAAVLIGIVIGTFFVQTFNSTPVTSEGEWTLLTEEYLPEYDSNPYYYINENE